MLDLSVTDAIAFVRKSLDEVYSNDSGMLHSEDTDNAALDEIVTESIAEAVRDVHLGAPAYMLDGVGAEIETDYELRGDVIEMNSPVLRLVSFKSSDSDITVTEVIEEDSPEGHQQLDMYLRGTYDDPRLVLLKNWQGSNRPRYRYFSFRSPNVEPPSLTIRFIPYPQEGAQSFRVSESLRYHTLNYLTALVLEVFEEYDKAQVFYKRAAFVAVDGK